MSNELPRGAAAVFVKTPGRSPVKTRLAADVGASRAIDVHRACAHAVAAVLRSCAPALTSYFAVAEAGLDVDAPSDWLPREWPQLPCMPQGEGELGARLDRVHRQLRQRHRAALLLGADSPQIEADAIAKALEWLADPAPRIAFGPAADGGFWLFGANVPIPAAVWAGVGYSRPDTGAVLLDALSGRAEVQRLPVLRDLDQASDLASVLRALDRLPAPLPEQRRVAALLRPLAAASTKVALPGKRI